MSLEESWKVAGRDKGAGKKVKEVRLGPYVLLEDGKPIARIKQLKVHFNGATPEQIATMKGSFFVILQRDLVCPVPKGEESERFK